MNDKFDVEKTLCSIRNEDVPADIRDISAGMISDFSRAVELAEINMSDKNSFVSWFGGLCYRFAGGAVFAVVIVFAFLFMTRTSSIAWADVVEAMGKVDQMRAKVIVEDPGSSDEKIFTIEMFYKAPDKCRAHGRGFVQFIEGNTNSIFSVEKGELLTEGTRYPSVIPHGFMELLKKKGLLNATLEMLFMGKVPKAEPVISTTALVRDGIEVFDYANDVNEMWARIWVLKESQLPVRIKIFYPDRNETNLVIFDYSDSQKDEFFDVDKFAAEASQIRKGPAYRFYNIGKSVVTANPRKPGKVKPTNPVHIHEIEGISAPVFKSIEQAGNGDLRIVALDPGNRDKNGRPSDGAYRDELRDNWGNIYIKYAGRSRYEKNRPIHHYYAPLEPFKKGEGVHKIKLLYTIWGYKHGVGYDKIVGNVEVIIPEAKSDGIPKHWYKNFNGTVSIARNDALRRINCAATNSVTEQWDYLNKLLEENPDDDSALQSKLYMIRDLKDEKAYLDFFEEHLLEKRLALRFSYVMHYSVLPRYLTYLYNNGRVDEYYKYREILNEKKEAFLNNKQTSKSQIERVKNHEWSLSMVLEIPAVVKKLGDIEKPKIVKTAVSADGKVIVQIDFPKDERGYMNRNIFSGGVRDAKTKKGGHFYNNQLYMFDKTGDKLTLEFSAVIEGLLKDKPGGSHPRPTIFTHVEIGLPKASDKNAEELKREFEPWQEFLDKILQEAEWVKVSRLAGQHVNLGDYEQGLAEYKKAVEIIDRELKKGNLTDSEIYELNQGKWMRYLNMSQCYVQVGKPDEAWELIEKARKISEKLTGNLPSFYTVVAVIDHLIEKNRLDKAEELLNKIGKDKPNLREYDNIRRVRKVYGGYTSNGKRSEVYSKWKPYYIAEWKLREARQMQKR